MHAGKSYKISEFLVWTRRKFYVLVLLGSFPVILYEVFELKWLDIPWAIIALLGTSTAFIVGFTNTQTYRRTDDGQQIWTSILSMSRSWGVICRDFIDNTTETRILVYRHLAWLTALRYRLREARVWETANKNITQNIKNTTQYQNGRSPWKMSWQNILQRRN
jgi:putative membrane protein